MGQYQGLANIYDRLVGSVDYLEWVKYIKLLFSLHGQLSLGAKGVDLACGTGNTTIPLAEQGYQMLGLDLSQDMLSLAAAKAEQQHLDINWTCQDMAGFELEEQQDFFVCYHDGVNYLPSYETFAGLLKQVDRYLKSGGLFIFDLVKVDKLKAVVDTATTVVDEEDLVLIYNTQYQQERWLINLTAFVRQEDGSFQRFDEQHQEKHHSLTDLSTALQGTGLAIVNVYKAYTLEPVNASTYRCFVVLKKL